MRRADLRRNVLHEGAAERDVQNLDAAADREHGFPPGFCLLDQRSFRRIARGVDGAYFFVALFAVASRIDVFTSVSTRPETESRIAAAASLVKVAER